jgi:hypothetical protein
MDVWDREMGWFLWRWVGCERWVDFREMGGFYGVGWILWRLVDCMEIGEFYGDGEFCGDGWDSEMVGLERWLYGNEWLRTQLTGFECRHLSKITNGRHGERPTHIL